MPRDAGGVYSLVAGYLATALTTILTSQHNPVLEDIAQSLTDSLPRNGAAAMTGALTLAADPVSALQAATKQYVDNLAAGLDVKPSVKVATTANISLTGEQTIDGILTSASRILVKNQSAPAQNGIYVTAAGAWARAADMDAWTEVPGASVWVEQGTTQADSGWVATADAGGTIGVTSITWQQFGGSGAFQAANAFLAALAALGPSLLAGDVFYATAANAPQRLAKGEAGQSLMQGASAPAWGLPAGFISGLTISRASATTFGIATGIAAGDNQGAITLASAFTKSLSAWAVGTGNGGLDTGAVGASTWYHVHLIRKDSDGSADVLYSLSAAAPTMPGGYTARRRIGSILTNGSSQITAFIQNGNVFTWDVPLSELNTTAPSTSAVSKTLTVPTGVVVYPIMAWSLQNATTTNLSVLITPLSITDTAPSTTLFTLFCASTNIIANQMLTEIPTNTSGQIRYRASAAGASDTLKEVTNGWLDTRGQ